MEFIMGSVSGVSSRNLLMGAVFALAVVSALAAVLMKDRTGVEGSGLGEEFQYDLAPLKKTDPALILYEESAPSIDTGFEEARAIATGPGDLIHVVGDRAIRVFRPEGGRPVREIPVEGGANCLAVAGDGTVYAGVRDHVEVFDPKGKRLAAFESAGPSALLTSIAVSGNHVFAADFSAKEVLHYENSGGLIGTLGEFVVPSPYFDVAVAEDGTLQVVNPGEHRIETYTFEGDLMIWWGEFSNTGIEGFSGCCNPVNFALLPDDGGFVTCEKGLTRVKVYDGGGGFIGVVAGPERFVRHDQRTQSPDVSPSLVGLDVAVDGKGRVLVLDPALSEIRIFTRKPMKGGEK
jgi:hypothetical protein